MTTKKAILVQLDVIAALLPCVMILNDNAETWYLNVLGLLYAVFMYRWLVCTQRGKKAVRAAENANKELLGDIYDE